MALLNRLTTWTNSNQRTSIWIGVGFLVFIAILLRLTGLGAESAWIDEAYSISLASHSIPEIIRGTAADQHPPFYYLILHFWFQLYSGGVGYARLLSVVFGLINVLQVLLIGKKMLGLFGGFTAALLIAISPVHIWYSQEARMYILLVTLTTMASLILWDNFQAEKVQKRWYLYGISATLSIYTHYFAVFIFIAHAVIVFIWTIRHHSSTVLRPWLVTMLLTVLAFSPWLPIAAQQSSSHTMTWIGTPGLADIRNAFARLLLGSGVIILPEWLNWIITSATIVLFLIPLIRYRGVSGRKADQLTFSAAWAVIPFVAIVGIALYYPIFQFKQFLIIVPGIMLWFVGTIRHAPRVIRIIAFAGVFVMLLASSVFQQTVLTKDDWRSAVAYIRERYSQEDVIYGNPAAVSLSLSLYWEGEYDFGGYPPDYDIITGGWDVPKISPEIAGNLLEGAISGHQRLWLVEFSPQFHDPEDNLVTWLNQHGNLLTERSFGQIQVQLYRFE